MWRTNDPVVWDPASAPAGVGPGARADLSITITDEGISRASPRAVAGYAWYNVLVNFAVARAATLGLTRMLAHRTAQECGLCGQPFFQDKVPPTLVRIVGEDRVEFCGNCLSVLWPRLEGGSTDRTSVLQYLRDLTELIGHLPRQDFGQRPGDFGGLDTDTRRRVLELLAQRPSVNAVKDIFGSHQRALFEAGLRTAEPAISKRVPSNRSASIERITGIAIEILAKGYGWSIVDGIWRLNCPLVQARSGPPIVSARIGVFRQHEVTVEFVTFGAVAHEGKSVSWAEIANYLEDRRSELEEIANGPLGPFNPDRPIIWRRESGWADANDEVWCRHLTELGEATPRWRGLFVDLSGKASHDRMSVAIAASIETWAPYGHALSSAGMKVNLLSLLSDAEVVARVSRLDALILGPQCPATDKVLIDHLVKQYPTLPIFVLVPTEEFDTWQSSLPPQARAIAMSATAPEELLKFVQEQSPD